MSIISIYHSNYTWYYYEPKIKKKRNSFME